MEEVGVGETGGGRGDAGDLSCSPETETSRIGCPRKE